MTRGNVRTVCLKKERYWNVYTCCGKHAQCLRVSQCQFPTVCVVVEKLKFLLNAHPCLRIQTELAA